MYHGMKRDRDDESTEKRIMSMANYLTSMLAMSKVSTNPQISRVFECKTCNRQFPSFQALGGHRASHKKLKSTNESSNNNSLEWIWPGQKEHIFKAKAHECSICGLEFSMGQALGGHMRKHRVASSSLCETEPTLSLSRSSVSNVKTGSICLDLNLAPPGNGLDFQLEKVFPLLH
ncbi:zinc finger protein ZAT11-like [Impatiens glandulifera]|uniref:zinc finger protein ZAT11-like n=1 Tax=Impatiens glandulifera TaxID=253017 RepID=UPI001FB0F094|nr:zinc finger protein ZAT11-like [Impatiens glandulifera]